MATEFPFLGKRTRWLDLYFCSVPVFAGVQYFLYHNAMEATGMIGIAAVLLVFRPLIKPGHMGTILSKADLQKLNDGQSVELEFFQTTVSLTPDKRGDDKTCTTN